MCLECLSLNVSSSSSSSSSSIAKMFLPMVVYVDFMENKLFSCFEFFLKYEDYVNNTRSLAEQLWITCN